jgi:hypothetical protein
MKSLYQGETCTPVFITAQFTVAKKWKQPKYPSTDEWINKCGTYTQWNNIQPQKPVKTCLQQHEWNRKTLC